MIILEGMDGSGKSTLAKWLNHIFMIPVIHPGAPPSTEDLETGMMIEQSLKMHKNIIMDRVTCISQQVYQKKLGDTRYTPFNEMFSKSDSTLIIYCRPPDSLLLDANHHKPSPHDTPEMLKLVNDNLELFTRSYDILMSKTKHVVYNYTIVESAAIIVEVVNNHLRKHHEKKR